MGPFAVFVLLLCTTKHRTICRYWTYLGPDFGKWNGEAPPPTIPSYQLRKNALPRPDALQEGCGVGSGIINNICWWAIVGIVGDIVMGSLLNSYRV
jgi:hypothetical protein